MKLVRTFSIAALLGIGSGSAPLSSDGDWPQILGPDRAATYDGSDLADGWGPDGPRVLWSRDVGTGFAGPVVSQGVVFVHHRVADSDLVDALGAADGKQIWRTSRPSTYRDDFGFNNGPRSTPVIAGDRVYTTSALGVVRALDRTSGDTLWTVDTAERFGAEKGFFGVASSPIVVGDLLLANVGGRDGAGIVALRVDSGELAWKATEHGASYSSPVRVSPDGRDTALFFTRAGLVGVEPVTGEVRFEFPWRSRLNASVNAASPVVVGDKVFLSSSYGVGAVLIGLAGGEPQEVWRSDRALTNHYATSVHHEGYLYGFHGRQEQQPSLRCVRLETGEVIWSQDRFGGGTLLVAGDRLLIVRESGDLVIAPATPDGFAPSATARILPPTIRAYPALADGVLYVRNEIQLVAIDLRPTGASAAPTE